MWSQSLAPPTPSSPLSKQFSLCQIIFSRLTTPSLAAQIRESSCGNQSSGPSQRSSRSERRVSWLGRSLTGSKQQQQWRLELPQTGWAGYTCNNGAHCSSQRLPHQLGRNRYLNINLLYKMGMSKIEMQRSFIKRSEMMDINYLNKSWVRDHWSDSNVKPWLVVLKAGQLCVLSSISAEDKYLIVMLLAEWRRGVVSWVEERVSCQLRLWTVTSGPVSVMSVTARYVPVCKDTCACQIE